MASPEPAATDLLTTEEVIEALHSDPVLRRAALSCVLPAVRVGTEWRFRRGDLDQWIARQFD